MRAPLSGKHQTLCFGVLTTVAVTVSFVLIHPVSASVLVHYFYADDYCDLPAGWAVIPDSTCIKNPYDDFSYLQYNLLNCTSASSGRFVSFSTYWDSNCTQPNILNQSLALSACNIGHTADLYQCVESAAAINVPLPQVVHSHNSTAQPNGVLNILLYADSQCKNFSQITSSIPGGQCVVWPYIGYTSSFVFHQLPLPGFAIDQYTDLGCVSGRKYVETWVPSQIGTCQTLQMPGSPSRSYIMQWLPSSSSAAHVLPLSLPLPLSLGVALIFLFVAVFGNKLFL